MKQPFFADFPRHRPLRATPARVSGRRRALLALMAIGISVGVIATGATAITTSAVAITPATVTTTVATTLPVTIAAVGDMECGDSSPTGPGLCESQGVAKLISDAHVAQFIALGDTQYANGAAAAYLNHYDKTWGALKPITWPVVGNHEWETAGASGYAGYFGTKFDVNARQYRWVRHLGDWQIIGLDSNCGKIDCTTAGGQYRWLQAHLSKTQRCTIVAFHHPLLSTEAAHIEPRMQATWALLRRYHVDVALTGHVHAYERMQKLSATLQPLWNGIRPFTVGTGGKETYQLNPPIKRSKTLVTGSYGALFLTLNSGAYSWEFRNSDGAVLDHGTDTCTT